MSWRGALVAAGVGVVLAVLLASWMAPDEVDPLLPGLSAGGDAPAAPPPDRPVAGARRAPPGPAGAAPSGRHVAAAPADGEPPPTIGAGPRRGTLDAQAIRALPGAASLGSRPVAGGERGTGGGGAETPDGFRGPRAEERAHQLEARVVDLLTTVAPELEGVAVSRTCAPSGRSCTFEGPWPGDDFALRWVEALADGTLGSETLGGVTFGTFEQVSGPEGDTFLIVADQPPGRVLE